MRTWRNASPSTSTGSPDPSARIGGSTNATSKPGVSSRKVNVTVSVNGWPDACTSVSSATPDALDAIDVGVVAPSKVVVVVVASVVEVVDVVDVVVPSSTLVVVVSVASSSSSSS